MDILVNIYVAHFHGFRLKCIYFISESIKISNTLFLKYNYI